MKREARRNEVEEFRRERGGECQTALEEGTERGHDSVAILREDSEGRHYAPVAVKEVLTEDEICENRLAGEGRMVVLDAVEADGVVVLREEGKKGGSGLCWVCFHERNDDGSDDFPRVETRGRGYETSGLFSWMRLLRWGKTVSKKSGVGIAACIHSNWERR